MNVQVFGFKNCQDTRKALRFFSERRIAVHFVNLDKRAAAPGELRRFSERYGPAALIDRKGARFRDLGLRVAGDSPERLLHRVLDEPRLLRTPLVRGGNRVSLGHAPDDWAAWLAADQARS